MIRVLVAVEDSKFSQAALQAVVSQIRPADAGVRVLHAVAPLTVSASPQMAAACAPALQDQIKTGQDRCLPATCEAHIEKCRQNSGVLDRDSSKSHPAFRFVRENSVPSSRAKPHNVARIHRLIKTLTAALADLTFPIVLVRFDHPGPLILIDDNFYVITTIGPAHASHLLFRFVFLVGSGVKPVAGTDKRWGLHSIALERSYE